METLLEDYKRKLKSVKELIDKQHSNGSIVHQRREERLNTKAAEYRAFIVDIERAMARQQQQSSANCAIFDVSGSLPSEEDKEVEMMKKANRITHEEHRFGFITGFEYCYEWLTKTGVYSGNDR